jgi:hypothetical protein
LLGRRKVDDHTAEKSDLATGARMEEGYQRSARRAARLTTGARRGVPRRPCIALDDDRHNPRVHLSADPDEHGISLPRQGR